MSRLTDIIRPFILDAALPREVDVDYPVDGKTWEVEQAILAWVEKDVIGEGEEPDITVFNTSKPWKLVYSDEAWARNQLRDEQRKRARV